MAGKKPEEGAAEDAAREQEPAADIRARSREERGASTKIVQGGGDDDVRVVVVRGGIGHDVLKLEVLVRREIDVDGPNVRAVDIEQ